MVRKAKRTLLAIALIAALALCGLAGCSGESNGGSQGGDTLRVGVRDDVMNFSYLNEQTHEYYGLEIDLANDLAERLGYENIEFSTVTPDDRRRSCSLATSTA